MKQSTKSVIERIDARLFDTEHAVLVSAKNELERVSADYSEVSKFLLEIANSEIKLPSEILVKLHKFF